MPPGFYVKLQSLVIYSLIAALQNGDTIALDLINHTLEVKLSEAEIQSRLRRIPPREPRVTSPWLRRYAHFVTSAHTGAVLKTP